MIVERYAAAIRRLCKPRASGDDPLAIFSTPMKEW